MMAGESDFAKETKPHTHTKNNQHISGGCANVAVGNREPRDGMALGANAGTLDFPTIPKRVSFGLRDRCVLNK